MICAKPSSKPPTKKSAPLSIAFTKSSLPINASPARSSVARSGTKAVHVIVPIPGDANSCHKPMSSPVISCTRSRCSMAKPTDSRTRPSPSRAERLKRYMAFAPLGPPGARPARSLRPPGIAVKMQVRTPGSDLARDRDLDVVGVEELDPLAQHDRSVANGEPAPAQIRDRLRIGPEMTLDHADDAAV